MKVSGEILVVTMVIGAAAWIGACKGRDAAFWCREDTRRCFSSESACVHEKSGKNELACFSQSKAFCYVIRGELLDSPAGETVCVPTEDECHEWQRVRIRQRPALQVGSCIATDPT